MCLRRTTAPSFSKSPVVNMFSVRTKTKSEKFLKFLWFGERFGQASFSDMFSVHMKTKSEKDLKILRFKERFGKLRFHLLQSMVENQRMNDLMRLLARGDLIMMMMMNCKGDPI